ncbi:hypothetical protein AYO44_13655 [Planctomycetaceae bacterium SCGC AG-212-F19]|nr:hypothetical protein AYO44_13655 [Planctomycetaceae bacterium SCGC AG-212-F19]
MTELEWMVCDDSQKMLSFLRSRASDRKLRLFGCACYRQIWFLVTDAPSRNVIEYAERFADGNVTEKQLMLMRQVASNLAVLTQAWGAWIVAEADAWDCAIGARESTVSITRYDAAEQEPTGLAVARAIALLQGENGASIAQCKLLREMFGNPFRPVALSSAWQTTNVVALARAIYDERAFDRMPILADALEDAGCDNADILNHCRQPGEHVRGCWVVDLLLGKK